MRVQMKYVLKKRLRDGTRAWYWNPPRAAREAGFVAEALGANESAALARALALNAHLEEWRHDTGGPRRGTTTWLIREYQRDPVFETLAASTQRMYGEALRRIESTFGPHLVNAVQYRHAKRFYEDLRAPSTEGGSERLGTANGTIRVARVLWRFAVDEDVADANPFRRVRLKSLPSRTVLWHPSQVAAFVAKADEMGHSEAGTAALIAFELAQRQGDVLALPWSRYDGAKLEVRQNKTGAPVTIPLKAVPALKARIDATDRLAPQIIVRADGSPWAARAKRFRRLVRRIADAAGLPNELRFMDLRRSGMTELADAGATDDELRAVSGHKTRNVVSMYVMPSGTQAGAALSKRARARKRLVNKSRPRVRMGQNASQNDATR